MQMIGERLCGSGRYLPGVHSVIRLTFRIFYLFCCLLSFGVFVPIITQEHMLDTSP
jgi:hypothetical protein